MGLFILQFVFEDVHKSSNADHVIGKPQLAMRCSKPRALKSLRTGVCPEKTILWRESAICMLFSGPSHAGYQFTYRELIVQMSINYGD